MFNVNRVCAFFLISLLFALVPIVNGQTTCADGEWLIDATCQTLDDSLGEGWHTVEPQGTTRCAHDTDFRFWVRPGSADVLLYFQGGGGCWNQETCQQGSNFYKQSAGRNEAITYRNGIFDFDNPENPFADYTMIFAPSCTGDVYMGSGFVDYGDSVTVHHRGYDNLMSAVNFTLDYAPQAESIFTAGCSAGSVGSAMAVPHLIEAYPETPVTQLGDSLGLIFDTESDMNTLWATPDFYTEALSQFAPDLSIFTMHDYYIGLGQAYPEHRFAQFNYQYDNVQQRYFAIGADNPRDFIGAGLPASLTTIDDATDNFSYYLADANSHCILPSSDLYRRTENGVSALDWITAVANGEVVESVD